MKVRLEAGVSPQTKDLMFYQGGVIVFGPTYLDTLKGIMQYIEGKAVLGCERIDDLTIPSTLMLDCLMIFAHFLPTCKGKRVTQKDLQEWKIQLLNSIVFRAATPLENVPATYAFQEPEETRMDCNQTNNEIILMVRWGPVESDHCVEVARALERSYKVHGGYYVETDCVEG